MPIDRLRTLTGIAADLAFPESEKESVKQAKARPLPVLSLVALAVGVALLWVGALPRFYKLPFIDALYLYIAPLVGLTLVAIGLAAVICYYAPVHAQIQALWFHVCRDRCAGLVEDRVLAMYTDQIVQGLPRFLKQEVFNLKAWNIYIGHTNDIIATAKKMRQEVAERLGVQREARHIAKGPQYLNTLIDATVGSLNELGRRVKPTKRKDEGDKQEGAQA